MAFQFLTHSCQSVSRLQYFYTISRLDEEQHYFAKEEANTALFTFTFDPNTNDWVNDDDDEGFGFWRWRRA